MSLQAQKEGEIQEGDEWNKNPRRHDAGKHCHTHLFLLIPIFNRTFNATIRVHHLSCLRCMVSDGFPPHHLGCDRSRLNAHDLHTLRPELFRAGSRPAVETALCHRVSTEHCGGHVPVEARDVNNDSPFVLNHLGAETTCQPHGCREVQCNGLETEHNASNVVRTKMGLPKRVKQRCGGSATLSTKISCY